MQKSINVIIVENERMTRKVYEEKLRDYNINCIAEASNGLELLDLLRVDKIKPDVTLLDLDMPMMNGREAFNIVRKEFPQFKIIILTGYNHGSLINDYLEKGACAFVSKEDMEINELANIIRKTHSSFIPAKPEIKATSIFTEGEMRIIPMLCKGWTSAKIAKHTGKATSTINGYIERMLLKTETKNTKELSSHCSLLGLHLLDVPPIHSKETE